MFYFVTSLVVSLLVTGSMAERAHLGPMMGFVGLQTFFIYPLVMSWSWSPYGGW